MYKIECPTQILKIDSYNVLAQFSQAGQARVYKVEKDNQILIAKTYDNEEHSIKCYQREVRCFEKINDKYASRMVYCNKQAQIFSSIGKQIRPCIFIEFLQGGDIHSYISKQMFPQQVVKKICKSMISIVEYLNSIKIIHRDIKPANILFNSDYKIKLIDFGLAQVQGDYSNQKVGTPSFMAPQVIKFKKYGISSQIFSIGVTLFACLLGFYPFQNAKYTDQRYRLLMQKKYKEFWKLTQKKYDVQKMPSKNFQTLFQQMTNYDDKKRQNTDFIRDSQWLNEYQQWRSLKTYFEQKKISWMKSTSHSESEGNQQTQFNCIHNETQ